MTRPHAPSNRCPAIRAGAYRLRNVHADATDWAALARCADAQQRANAVRNLIASAPGSVRLAQLVHDVTHTVDVALHPAGVGVVCFKLTHDWRLCLFETSPGQANAFIFQSNHKSRQRDLYTMAMTS